MSRTIVVTGGGRGIGRAIALAFAGPGAKIVITSRTASQLEQTAVDIRATGAEAFPVQMDVSDEASVAHGFGTLHGQVTKVDVLVNNAGVGGGEVVQGADVQRWRQTIDTNLTGMFLVTRQVLPLMADHGRIINMSSVLGRFGAPGYTAYCASKHGVIGFTRALALELAKRKITVNALAPGWVDTDMAMLGMTQGASHAKITFDEFKDRQLSAVPIKRLIDPAEVAALTTFLCSADASAITGQTYNICGGQTMD
ncbi:MAG TPA: SDR family NAD(P)-dependent oxidoreductase [Vicinamibacterales bacterium]|nr:SDR family NAD(P)-dependent oxidoreductase [Vicinamibacterales bacterium]